MEIRLASLISGATDAVGTTVIIDVFRAFTTAAVALSRGARRILMVDTLEKAWALRSSGAADCCIGERGSVKPPGFDFGNREPDAALAEHVVSSKGPAARPDREKTSGDRGFCKNRAARAVRPRTPRRLATPV